MPELVRRAASPPASGRARARARPRPKLTLLRKIESGIESTRPASTGLSHQKYAGTRMKRRDAPDQRRTRSATPWVRMASRQSVPSSSAPRFCATQATPWPSEREDDELRVEDHVDRREQRRAERSPAARWPRAAARPPNRAASLAAGRARRRRSTTFGRNSSSIVNDEQRQRLRAPATE